MYVLWVIQKVIEYGRPIKYSIVMWNNLQLSILRWKVVEYGVYFSLYTILRFYTKPTSLHPNPNPEFNYFFMYPNPKPEFNYLPFFILTIWF